MERREFIKQSAAALAVAATAKTNSSAAQSGLAARPAKPNVLFVIADEWRGQALGYARDVNAHTPTLNRLAKESINFTNSISGLPLCCPARASFQTGQYPLKNGVFVNAVSLVPNTTTLAQAFKGAGYRTALIGKWHLCGSPDGHYGRRGAYIQPDRRFGYDYWKAAECIHDYNHSLYYEGDDATARFWPGYDAIAQTDDACHYIESGAKAQEPFFLTVSFGPPHFPYATAPEQYRAMYETREIHLRPNVPPGSVKEATTNSRGYYSHIAALDDCLKTLLDTLETLGIAQDTIVVFTSDHGDMMGSQGLTGKLFPWDESLRTPFLVRYPRKLGVEGKQLENPLNSPDIMPTLLGLSEIQQPDGLQGIDYSSLLLGRKTADSAKSAFIYNPVSTFQLRQCGIASYRGVRTSSHTYIRSIRGPWLLYDNVADPYQMHNLCGRPEVRQIQSELEQELGTWLMRLDDKFLSGEEYLRQSGLGYYFETKTPIGHYRSPWGDWESTMS